MISLTITPHWKCYFPDYFVNKHENTLLASSESDLGMKFVIKTHIFVVQNLGLYNIWIYHKLILENQCGHLDFHQKH